MFLGLAVAALWGVGDLFAAISARRLGTFATLFVAQATELALCIVLWALGRPSIALGPGSTVALLVVGVLTAASYGSLYRGLMLGPVSLVSPIAAAYAVGPTILAVVLLDERLSLLGSLGAGATIVGVTAATVRSPSQGDRTRTGGVPYALGAMIGFGLSAFLIAAFAADFGWLPPVLISRIGVAGALAAAMAGVPTLASSVRSAANGSRAVPAAAAAGTCNLGGTVLYAYSGELGQVAVVSAVSALFPLVPIVGGLLMFRERLGRLQIAGIAMIAVGLILLHPA